MGRAFGVYEDDSWLDRGVDFDVVNCPSTTTEDNVSFMPPEVPPSPRRLATTLPPLSPTVEVKVDGERREVQTPGGAPVPATSSAVPTNVGYFLYITAIFQLCSDEERETVRQLVVSNGSSAMGLVYFLIDISLLLRAFDGTLAAALHPVSKLFFEVDSYDLSTYEQKRCVAITNRLPPKGTQLLAAETSTLTKVREFLLGLAKHDVEAEINSGLTESRVACFDRALAECFQIFFRKDLNSPSFLNQVSDAELSVTSYLNIHDHAAVDSCRTPATYTDICLRRRVQASFFASVEADAFFNTSRLQFEKVRRLLRMLLMFLLQIWRLRARLRLTPRLHRRLRQFEAPS